MNGSKQQKFIIIIIIIYLVPAYHYLSLHNLYGLYGNTYPSYLDELTILTNKLLRILQKKGRTCCNERLSPVQYSASCTAVQLPGLESRTQSSILSSFIAFYIS